MNEVLTERSEASSRCSSTGLGRERDDHRQLRALAEALETAAKDMPTRVVLIHGAGDSFTPATISRIS